MKKNALLLLPLLIFCSCQSEKTTEFNDAPNWSKEAVWYQIFPERFSNGDTNNDPGPVDMEGAWPYFTPDDWQIHPWNSDWYKLQSWEAKLNKNFYDIVNIRRYGGDLQGVIDKLDYLKELGITAIYLNPIFESPSLHKYDATFYHHIDNNFGPDPDGDRKIWSNENHGDPSTWQWTSADKLFLKLIDEVHKRDMKIIIDGVFNHTGTQFWAFKDIVQNQKNSAYKDWFIINKWDDPNSQESEFEYAGWMGVRDLPEIKEDQNGLVTGPREHVHAVVKRWMDPNGDGDPSDGIDGWRLDVAEMVNHNFWKEFRKWVREINPDAYLVGEVWWEDWNNYKMFNAKPWLGDQFDAVMNYRFTRAVKDFVLADKVKIDAITFTDSIKNIMNNYGENYYGMMNLLGSHDTERLGSLAVNPDGMYDHQGNARDNKEFDVRKPNDEELKRIKLAYGLQFTMPGAPQVYNGDEAGMWGGDDPDCRKPMVWDNMEFETETAHPFGKNRQPDPVTFNNDLFNWIKSLTKIRKENSLLSLGSPEFFVIDNDSNILSYRLKNNDAEIVVVVNRNSEPVEINTLSVKFLESKSNWKDLVSGSEIQSGNNVIKLESYGILILK